MAAVVHSSGAGALLLVAFALAALRWGTAKTIRRSLELVAILGVAAVALVALLRRRPVRDPARAGRRRPAPRRLDRPDDDDRAFERWQRERWREASARTSHEGYGSGFGGKG